MVLGTMKAHNTPFSAPEQDAAPLTPQQQRLREKSGALSTYRDLVVGADRGYFSLLLYELYSLFCAGLPGVLGFAARAALLPRLLGACGGGLKCGRSLTLRLPSKIRLGRGVFLDDYAVLDVRESKEAAGEAGIRIEDNVFIGRNTILAAKGAPIHLAEACNISSECRIATESGVRIGESTLIAAYVYIGPGNHRRDESGKLLVEASMEKKGGVSIGRGCWIGARATILDGVSIGDGAVIGAHSLVRDDVPAGAVAAGVPAKIIS